MSLLSNVKFSVLDLASVQEGGSISQTFANSRALARHVEKLGYERYWLAEHHNLAGIASAATSVLIGNIAGVTTKIRVGSGGVMLPNHSPLVIAEQFGTLEALYPGRIDLGLGRAPGTDTITMRALGRDVNSADDFPQRVLELLFYLKPAEVGQRVQAIPGAGSNVPVWLLGSSTFSAQLAAEFGLPFAFAGQFAPAQLFEALAIYRNNFKKSDYLTAPYCVLGLNIIAASDDKKAEYLASTMYQKFLGMVRGKRGLAAAPVSNMDEIWTPQEKRAVDSFLSASIIGGPDTLQTQMTALLEKTNVNELMINSDIFDQTERRNSFQIIATLKGSRYF